MFRTLRSGLQLHIVGADNAADSGVTEVEVVTDGLLGVVAAFVGYDYSLIT